MIDRCLERERETYYGEKETFLILSLFPSLSISVSVSVSIDPSVVQYTKVRFPFFLYFLLFEVKYRRTGQCVGAYVCLLQDIYACYRYID